MGKVYRFDPPKRRNRSGPARLPASIDEWDGKEARYYGRSSWSKMGAYRRTERAGLSGRATPPRNRAFALTALFLMGAVFAATFLWLRGGDGAGAHAAAPLPLVSPADREQARFGFCHSGGGTNCVVDGDTLYYRGTKIRIADIDTPETHEPRCAAEASKGAAATQRLRALVNAGPFSLEQVDRDEDVYGRKLRIVTRGGESLGGVLVEEGLARWYAGGRRGWC